jgi:hypothetical protein
MSVASARRSPIQETKVWQKAGIVVTASLAALLALAPLAHAEPSPEGDDGKDDAEQVITGDDAPQEGLINLGDLNLLNGVNICPDVTAVVAVGNLLGILGSGTTNVTVADAPITCETTVIEKR